MNMQSMKEADDFIGLIAPKLLVYLKRFAGNVADSEDILQETLLKIRNGYSSFEGRAQAHNWAYRIATNAAVDFFRKNNRDTVPFIDLPSSNGDGEDDERLVIDEMNSCVRGVIERLPPEHRAATVLFHLEDKSIDEISEILNITPGAARVRIHRGKQQLKEALGRQCVFYQTREGTVRCDRK